MALHLLESATQLRLCAPQPELDLLTAKLRYRPARYWASDAYQLWRRHQKAIAAANAAGELLRAQELSDLKVGWDGWRNPLKKSKPRPSDDPNGTPAVLLRGWTPVILDLAQELDLVVDAAELLVNPFDGITEDDVPDDLLAVELDPNQWAIQRRCVVSWLQRGMARHMVTVSGGKTAMFCAAAAMVKRRFPQARFLYLTPTERLVSQVYKESRKFLPEWHITQFGGAIKEDDGRDLVVATDAILNTRFDELAYDGWFKTFMCILNDECHRSASPSRSKVLLSCGAYFRFAASDTTKADDPDAHAALTGLCGPVVERVEPIELLNIDRVARPTINVVSTKSWHGKFDGLSHEPAPDTPAWVLADGEWRAGKYLGPAFELEPTGELKLHPKTKAPIQAPGLHRVLINDEEFQVESRWCLLHRKYDQAIIAFNERNTEVARWVKHYTDQGWPTLVVATRTLHVLILEAVIKKHVPPDKVRILYGMHGSDERDAAFEWFKSTPGAVLISPLVKVGVSINELKAGVIADIVGDPEYARQLIGRFIRRKFDGPNTAQITWFIETQHRGYEAGSRRLLNRLREVEGFEWQEVAEPPLQSVR